MGHRIRIPGEGGKIEARNAKLRAAIAAEFARLDEAKKPKPQAPVRRTFPHIRHYNEAGR
jgi:hypothetical protein